MRGSVFPKLIGGPKQKRLTFIDASHTIQIFTLKTDPIRANHGVTDGAVLISAVPPCQKQRKP